MNWEHCNCPGPGGRAAIAPTGCCPRCGVQGSQRAAAIRDALASQNWRPALDQARAAGHAAGYRAGLAEGRRQALAALLDPAALPAPVPVEAGPGWAWPPTPDPIGAAA
jgi:hypothetical protein